jgi:pimeloyl-ACP methyl ester carboxylesterase
MSFVTASGFTLHLRRIEGGRPGAPPLVFLHEGLGTIPVWGDVPDVICEATGCPAVVYERPGYGVSDPRPLPWPDDVLEQEAEIVLPALLDALSIDRLVLIGHSDGGTIALLYAAAFLERVRAVITLAAHVVLDELTLAGVTALERSSREGDLRAEIRAPPRPRRRHTVPRLVRALAQSGEAQLVDRRSAATDHLPGTRDPRHRRRVRAASPARRDRGRRCRPCRTRSDPELRSRPASSGAGGRHRAHGRLLALPRK